MVDVRAAAGIGSTRRLTVAAHGHDIGIDVRHGSFRSHSPGAGHGLAPDAPSHRHRTLVTEAPCLVVSPHLDDAVFGCGDFLARHPGAFVATVFAGHPRVPMATAWDRRCGFADAEAAMRGRRQEDLRALSILGARPSWLPFLDAQYQRPVAPARITTAVRRILARMQAASVVLPLGLFHSDHRLVSDALLALQATAPAKRWYCYADALYRFLPGLCEARLAELAARGLQLQPRPATTTASTLKQAAVACYASQLRALAASGHVRVESIFAPEQRWEMTQARR